MSPITMIRIILNYLAKVVLGKGRVFVIARLARSNLSPRTGIASLCSQ